MIKASFIFNSDVQVVLTPENEEDKALLSLAFNGRLVQTIKDGGKEKESTVLVLIRSEVK